MLQSGSRLGPYEILAPLGEGGMGEVYRARDPRLDREVAIKVLPPEFATDVDRLRRFELEARAASALSHPGITTVFELGSQEGTPFLVTELLAGQTLRSRLAAGPLPARKAADLAAQVARALAVAHEHGIVHRDLKPENLFLTRDGRMKILDFGLARAIGPPAGLGDLAAGPTVAMPTQPGMVLGTVGYMAPEQVRGEPAGPGSDLFALGCVLFELLTGRRAFAGDTAIAALHAILEHDPLADRTGLEASPPALLGVLERCLEKSPTERFRSAHDLALALDAAGTASAWSGAEGALAPARRRPAGRAAIAAAAVLVGCGIALAGWWLGREAGARRHPTFAPLTFRRGTVHAARFTPDGQSVVYSAAWGDEPAHIYLKRPESPDSAPIGPPGAELAAISRQGELGILVDRRYAGPFTTVGTLGQLPLTGGAPRLLDESIAAADWSPVDGELAVVRDFGDRQQLELPRGTVLHETTGWLSDLRFSPDGRELAFLEHPARHDEGGSPVRLELATRRIRSELGGVPLETHGLVWVGEDLVYGRDREVVVIDRTGSQRPLVQLPQTAVMHDRSPDGRFLIAQATKTVTMTALDRAGERDLSWLTWSLVMDLTADGRQLVFTEYRGRAGPQGISALRGFDGSPVIELGEGFASGASPDGRWVVAVRPDPPHAVLLPTGAGAARRLPATGFQIVSHPRFMPDSRSIVFTGVAGDRRSLLYRQSIDGGEPRPASGEAVGFGLIAVAPGGAEVVTNGPDNRPWIYTLGGGARPLPGGLPGENAVRFTGDGRSVFIYRMGEVPARLRRVEVATGKRDELRSLAPSDRAGLLWVSPIAVTADGEHIAFSSGRVLSELFEVRGLE